MTKFRKPTGTHDFLPKEMAVRNFVERVIRETFEEYGFQQIKTPTYEEYALLSARSGEVIREKMFTFISDGIEYALRPELTAPICRLVSNGQLEQMPKPYKLYYIGQCFRYERPERDREFRQVGLELMGSSSHLADAEVIAVATKVLEKLSISDYRLEVSNTDIFRKILEEAIVDTDAHSDIISDVDYITSLREECGLLQTKSDFEQADVEYVKNEVGSLYRLQGGIKYEGEHKISSIDELKEESMKEWILNLPVTAAETYKTAWTKRYNVSEEYSNLLIEISGIRGNKETIIERAENLLKNTPACLRRSSGRQAQKAFQDLLQVCEWLDVYRVTNYEIVLGVTRGMDFYTGTVFKIDSTLLGAQKQICGGGRYDKLVAEFGGPEIPAIGFAFGLERVIELLRKTGNASVEQKIDYYIATTSEDLMPKAIEIANMLRKKGKKVETDLMGRGLTTQLDYADKKNCDYTVILDPQKLQQGTATLMDMKTGERQLIKISEIKEIPLTLRFAQGQA
jgi:histidyl-tRNA synthetase